MITLNRRQLFATAAGLGLAAACRTSPAAAQSKRLTVVSWGGSYQKVQSETLWKPAAEKLGIDLVEETYNGLADIRLRVRSGAVAWDVVSIGAGGAARAASEGLLEPIDYKLVDTAAFIPGYAAPSWVGSDLYSTALAWRSDKYPDEAPKSWADFWDVKRFPGARAYRNQALGHLEPALMAEGVPADQVYKELSTESGLKAAIAKIAELKPHIATFWASGAHQAQFLKDGVVDMTSGWSGQLIPLQQDGVPIALTFNQAILDADVFVVPKGAPNAALAMTFLDEISKPEYQAALANAAPYGAVNQRAYTDGLISEQRAKLLPSSPANVKAQLKLDTEWWKENQTKAEKLYQEMLTS